MFKSRAPTSTDGCLMISLFNLQEKRIEVTPLGPSVLSFLFAISLWLWQRYIFSFYILSLVHWTGSAIGVHSSILKRFSFSLSSSRSAQ